MTESSKAATGRAVSGAPETVYLHIGLHKTGTTYLQNVLRANRDHVRAQQIDFPGGPGEPVQAFAVWDLQGRRPRGAGDERIAGSWDVLVDAVNTSGLRSALISEERLSLCTLRQAQRAVSSFPDSQVQVIVTVRDLGRVAVSAWQEEVKNDQTYTWQAFVDSIKDPSRVAVKPARGFWFRQDVVKICETWESVVPASRLHVITVPRSGASADVLLGRFASVVGFEPDSLTEEPAWNNETVGVAATEVIRRVNERLGGRLNQRQHDKVIKLTLAPMLAQRTEAARFSLPPEEMGWITERADQMIEALQQRGYPLTGDLSELRPEPTMGTRRPDDATEPELLEASLDALAMLAERHATSWWIRKQPDLAAVAARAAQSADLASKTRGLVFRGQRRAAELADKFPVAAKAMSAVLSRRDRARTKAAARSRSEPK
ncbi:MAG: hypothetical protein H0V49_04985 [Nocardioidaceae bacterium]|nr:hypothetical protein [Nocardioidaceae bacterium]